MLESYLQMALYSPLASLGLDYEKVSKREFHIMFVGRMLKHTSSPLLVLHLCNMKFTVAPLEVYPILSVQ